MFRYGIYGRRVSADEGQLYGALTIPSATVSGTVAGVYQVSGALNVPLAVVDGTLSKIEESVYLLGGILNVPATTVSGTTKLHLKVSGDVEIPLPSVLGSSLEYEITATLAGAIVVPASVIASTELFLPSVVSVPSDRTATVDEVETNLVIVGGE